VPFSERCDAEMELIAIDSGSDDGRSPRPTLLSVTRRLVYLDPTMNPASVIRSARTPESYTA
jgi:hypothetical protein